MSKLEQPLGGGHAEAAVSSTPSRKGKRMLLIEDEPLTRLVLLQKLRTAGFEVDFAPNGRIGLQKLRSGQPDAIFMDLLLPFVKGAKVIKEARRDPVFADRPIYVCTSAALMEAWTRQGIKAGATRVFNKASTPIDQIIAEVAADLTGPGANAQPSNSMSPDKEESEAPKEAPTKLEEEVAEQDTPPQPPAQSDDPEAPAAKSPVKPLGFMQRAWKSLGLSRANRQPSEPAASAEPAPVPAAQDPITSEAETAVWFRIDPKSKPADPVGEEAASVADRTNSVTISPDIGILQIDKEKKIVAASDLCAAIFSWEGSELIGQDVGVLLHGGLDNEVGQFLQRTEPADQSSERSSFHVTARRKDGTEFPASVVLTRRSADSRFCWTAIFRVSTSGTDSPFQTNTVTLPESRPAQGPPTALAVTQSQPQESQVTPASATEDLQKQFQAVAAEAAVHGEALAKSQKEHEQLLGRISSHELELDRARTDLERESEARKQLELTLQNLTRAKTDLERQLAEQRRHHEELEKSAGQLREQLNDAKAAAERAEAAARQEVGRANRFEEDLANLRKGYDELNGKLAAEQQAAAESKLRSEELEHRLRENAAELERVKADLARHGEERGRLESEWREQLDAANALTKKMETAWLEEAGRNKAFEERLRILSNTLKLEQAQRTKRFEEEVAGLGQAREELNAKLEAEQKAAEESRWRAEELEGRLRESGAEVERVKAELEKQAAEQKRLEGEWREQLNTAEALTKKLEAAWLEADERNKRFAQELASLRQMRDELNGKLTTEQQAAAESKRRAEELENRLRENTAELERVKAELKDAERTEHFETLLASLQKVRDELSGDLKSEQQATAQSRQRSDDLENQLRENTAELQRVKADRDKNAEQQASLESELREQLNTAKAAAECADAALKQQAAQCSRVENDLVTLRRAQEELNGKVTAEQHAAAESRRRGEELENELRESAAELERFKAERDIHAVEQARLESELRAQLDTAKSAAGRAEAALEEEAARNVGFEERLRLFGNSLRQEEAERSQRFEEELASLRQVRVELSGKLTAEQQAAAESRRRSEELENRLRENTGELERVKAELAKDVEEGESVESDWRAQLEAANALTKKMETAWLEEAGRNTGFEERLRILANSLKLEQIERTKRFDREVADLRQGSDELQGKLTAERQAAAESRRRAEELEGRLRQSGAEVERVKAVLEKQTAEQKGLEAEWREELNTAEALTKQLEAAWLKAHGRNKRFEQELAGLRHLHGDLNGRLQAEQQAAVESRRRAEELESRLRENTAELERVRAQLENADRNEHFEQRLTNLQQVRDELSGELKTEQQATAQSRQRSDDLENRLRDNTTELERVKADRDKNAEQQASQESELRAQLDAAKAAAERAEAALKEKAAQCSQVENDLVSLRQARDEVNGKLTTEQHAAAESRRRSEELENRLRDSAAELERFKADQDNHAAEQARLESALRAQLDAAKAAAGRAEAALEEEAVRNVGFEERLRIFGNSLRHEEAEGNKRFEAELAALRQAREELHGKFTAECQAAAESRRRTEELEHRLRENAGELERVKAELHKQTDERAGAESELRAQLDAAKAAVEHTGAAHHEETARRSQFEAELAGLRQVRDELNGKLSAEQQAAAESRRRSEELEHRSRENAGELERIKAELHKQAEERADTESELRAQLDAAKAKADQAKTSIKETIAQSKRSAKRFENELANLRQERHQVYDKFVAEQQAGAKSKRRTKELENNLREAAATVATAKSELEQGAAERGRVESEQRAELDAAKAAAQLADAAHQEETARRSRLEQELAEVHRKREELTAQLTTEQQAAAQSRHIIEELESRLRESAAEVERAKAALENEAPDSGEVATLEARVRDGVASQARLTADLEKERGARRRVERRAASLSAQLEKLHEDLKQHLESEQATHNRISELEQQMREKEAAVVRATDELRHETAERQLAEEQLRGVGDLSTKMREYLSLYEESKQAFKRAQADLETRLQANLSTLSECESKLQLEGSERHRLAGALAAVQRNFHEQSQRSAIELSKLQSELLVEQFERKRLEGDAIQSRCSSLDSARAGRAVVNSFRRQTRQPIDELMQSARRLLEVQLGDEQTKLVESVLENALLLQSSLQEAGSLSSNSPHASAEGQLDK